MKNVFILAFSLLLISEPAFSAKKSGKRAASQNGRRAASTRRAAARSMTRKTASTTTTSSSETTEEETTTEVKVKDKETCADIYNTCMDQKTNESLMIYEDLYNDYNDMLLDIYSGMSQPAFRCLYSDDVIALHTKYYYGSELTAPTSTSSSRKEVSDDSIDYYTFLRENAQQVASKKYSPSFLHEDVVKMANLDKKPLIQKEVSLPIVSYKVTALDPAKTYKANVEYCRNPRTNTNLDGCKKISDDVVTSWKAKAPNVSKSCEDYQIYLTEKKTESIQETKDFILGLSSKLAEVIEEYNLKVEADRELAALKAKEEEEKRLKELRSLSEEAQKIYEEGRKKGLSDEEIAKSVIKSSLLGNPVGLTKAIASDIKKNGKDIAKGAAAGCVIGGVVGCVAGAALNTSGGKVIRKFVKKLKFW